MPRMSHLSLARTLLFGVAAAALLPGLAQAQSVSFAGERITMIVPSGEGGSLDTYARAVAPVLSRELPGQPTILIQNIPGAGTMAGANQFEGRAQPDGLTILAVTTSTFLNYVFRNPSVEYDLASYQPILINPQGVVVYSHPSIVGNEPGNIQAAIDAAPLVFGGHSPASAEARHLLAFHLLGLDVTGVWGLGAGEGRLAFMRGELTINQESASSYLQNVVPLIENGEAIGLFSYGVVEDGQFVRDPIAPDVPTFWELYEARHGHPVQGAEREAFDALYATILANKGLVLPADTPEDIVETYRVALDNAMSRPEVLEQLALELGPYPNYLRDDAQAAYDLATTMTPTAWDYLAEFLRTNYDAAF